MGKDEREEKEGERKRTEKWEGRGERGRGVQE